MVARFKNLMQRLSKKMKICCLSLSFINQKENVQLLNVVYMIDSFEVNDTILNN